MEVKATLRNLRIAPRKVRRVADLVRGKSVAAARLQLKFNQMRAAKPLLKLIDSGVANAEHNFSIDTNTLQIKSLMVDQGPMMKRYMARAFGRGAEIDLAGVLDGQHMPAYGGRADLITPSVDHPFNGHPRVIEKSPKPDLLSPLPVCQMAQAHGRMRSHALEKHRPLLSRRQSPNRPNDMSSSNIVTLRVGQSVSHRITRQRSKGIPKVHPESLCHTTMCACPSAEAGTNGIKRRTKLSSSRSRI